MKYCLLTWLLITTGCSLTQSPETGSQTHFLVPCEDSCPAPFACLCGVCTTVCGGDFACEGFSPGAACLDTTSIAAPCETARMCDVPCSANDGCSLLGVRFTCESGRCRESVSDPPASSPDASIDSSNPADSSDASIDSSNPADLPDAGLIHYEEVLGQSGLFRIVSACELFSGPGPIGVFRVAEITQVSGVLRLYVTSDTLDVWFGDLDASFTFSFPGGDNGSGAFLTPTLSATVGERIVMIIGGSQQDLTVETELQIFREVDEGRFSNGQLFVDSGVSLEALREIIEQVRTSDPCPFDDDFGFLP
jgi:hypothetical protein